MTFSAAVLAGGRSTRMGTDKAFLHVGCELLLERQLRILRESGAKELLISGRSGVDYSTFGVRVVYDEYIDAGPLAGLAAILKAAVHRFVPVLAVDLPEMTTPMLQKIIAHCTEGSGCVPLDGSGYQPLAATYPKAALRLAQRELQAGRHSMQAFVKQAITDGLVQPLELSASEQLLFTNWNRPSDWIEPST
jgi:molybdopterin-guanine dinucleotide biosynthesis protein A